MKKFCFAAICVIVCVAGLAFSVWFLYLGYRAVVTGIQEGDFGGIRDAIIAVPMTIAWAIWLPAKVVGMVIFGPDFGPGTIIIVTDQLDGDAVPEAPE